MTNLFQDRQKEETRISYVLKEIDAKIAKANQYSGGIKQEVIHLRKTFWDDVTVNMEDAAEAAETMASIKQQSEMLSERERTHGQLHKELKKLERLKDTPYFGRVDFLEDGERNTDVVYLGTASLMDKSEENFLIYDWRAPISSIYYDYSPGEADYHTSEGVISGEMLLKRQFITKNGEIKSMFDTGVTIGDELLKEVLGNHANSHMKSIVATIQKEQNQIIRNEKAKYLVVQGVAGSGKTSVALQRVAYLLYRHLHELTSKNLMLFSPNPLFSSYIATVLPDLGEEELQQTTYHNYIETRLEKEFSLENPFSQMEYILTSLNNELYQARMANIRYKSSVEFKCVIDRYVKLLSSENLCFKKITFRGETLVSSESISEYFYSLDRSNSIPNRMQLVKEWLVNLLVRKQKIECTKEWVLEEIDLLDNEEYMKVYHELQNEQEHTEATFDDFEREQMKLAHRIVSKHFKPLLQAVKKLRFINVKKTYLQLFLNHDLAMNVLDSEFPSEWEEIAKMTSKSIRNNILTYEDATPYLYFLDKLEGQKTNTLIRHVFIDEAQDYSPFQFAVLKQLFPYCKMTILGDFNQAIYAHSLNAPTLLSSELYDKGEFAQMTLTKSYRSTRQIVEFTKDIVEQGKEIEAFNRNGSKPTLSIVKTNDELYYKITSLIKTLKLKGYETIAVICKTLQESKNTFEILKQDHDVQLMDHTIFSFSKGIIILPTYLAKGIEFDAVIIFNASRDIYERENERKLFYTACTRAMHELHLFSIGEKTKFMNQVPVTTYEIES